MWEPLIERIHQRSNVPISASYAFDAVNHGESATLNKDILGNEFSWYDNARDLNHMIDVLKIPQPIIAIGHSLGGCSVVLAHLARPTQFHSLITVDPVIISTPSEAEGKYVMIAVKNGVKDKEIGDITDPGSVAFTISRVFLLLAAAEKRRDTWPSRKEAKEGMLKKAFFRSWDPKILDIYLKYGLRDVPEGVTLSTPKMQERATFAETKGRSYAFDHLADISAPITFIIPTNTDVNHPVEVEKKKKVVPKKWVRGWESIAGGHLITMEKPNESADLILKHIEANLAHSQDKSEHAKL